jgi:4-diphosphocytidyl-2-C-methyl-D-erythritol kinase
MLTVKGNAKINLTLDVLYKREDGFHQVEMIMQSIDLADVLSLEERKTGDITIATTIARLPCDQRNLAYRAAALLKETCQVKSGVHIFLEKNIPVAAGLAGGSADAASVLIGLNRLWKLGLSTNELEILGAKLGSDVPFCIRGGTMLATGRGELLQPLTDIKPCYIVLAKPPVGVSTAWVYRQYKGQDVKVHPDTSGVKSSLVQGDLAGVAKGLCNVLETVTIPAHPEIKKLKQSMMQYGAMASLMSGSGPTVFGLVEDQVKAEYIAEKLRCQSAADIFVAKTVGKSEGV